MEGISSSDGVVEGKRARQDGDGDDKLADQLRHARICIGERIERVPLDLERVEHFGHGLRSLDPGRLDWVVVDGTGGANELLRVAVGDGPLGSFLEDAGRSGPVEVGDGVGVQVGQASQVILDDKSFGRREERSRGPERALRRRS